jgi:hypothetical protein
MKTSIYTSAFNIVSSNFDIYKYIIHAVNMADEVVIAVNTSKDNTLDVLESYKSDHNSIKLIQTDFSYSDPLLDGKIKNEALQATTGDLKIQLDLDEYIPLENKKDWLRVGNLFLKSGYKAIMIPVIDLYKDTDHIKNLGTKWYMHTPGLYRGVVNFGKLENGHVDIEKSDTTELIDSEGNLVDSTYLIDPKLPIDYKLKLIKNLNLPFVVHTGYLDLENRIHRNKTFWKSHWETEAGKEVNIPLEVSQLENELYIEHKLNID